MIVEILVYIIRKEGLKKLTHTAYQGLEKQKALGKLLNMVGLTDEEISTIKDHGNIGNYHHTYIKATV